MNNPDGVNHPEELLGAYALDALEVEEALQVEAHLEQCDQCQQSLAVFQNVAFILGESVQLLEPPATIQARLMQSLYLEPVAVAASPSVVRDSKGFSWSRLGMMAFPLAAALVVALFTTSLVMNLQLSDRMDRLEMENSTLSAQMLAQVSESQQVKDSLQQVRVTNYLIASPATQQLSLLPPTGRQGNSQGILLVSNDGHRAVLLLAGMDEPPPPETYSVWLRRGGQQTLVGQVTVDASGWGTLTLFPPEPMYVFDWVGLTAPEQPDASPGSVPQGQVVLGARISTVNRTE